MVRDRFLEKVASELGLEGRLAVHQKDVVGKVWAEKERVFQEK